MLPKQKYKEDLLKFVDVLPEKKIAQLIDFASFLSTQHSEKPKSKNILLSTVDNQALIMQQKSLSKIWDSPGEDVYEI